MPHGRSVRLDNRKLQLLRVQPRLLVEQRHVHVVRRGRVKLHLLRGRNRVVCNGRNVIGCVRGLRRRHLQLRRLRCVRELRRGRLLRVVLVLLHALVDLLHGPS